MPEARHYDASFCETRKNSQTEGFTPHPNPLPKGESVSGFTLAEVLITLGIIGIVAAMTLPTLIASYKEKARVTALKKIYSQMQNAFNLAVYEYGPIATWDLAVTDTGQTNENGEVILDNSGAETFMKNISQYFSKSALTEIQTREELSLDGRNINESPSTKLANDGNFTIITNDGFILRMGWIHTGGKSGDFWITLPNEKKWITGVTRFHFLITEKGFVPDGLVQENFAVRCNVKSKSVASNQNGRACTAWALQKENMEYLRCNDLSWDGKDKCN